MIGKLLKERKNIKTKADEIKTRKGCKECVELKQDLMTEYYWRKCYERSSKELVKKSNYNVTLQSVIDQMKDTNDDMSSRIEEYRRNADTMEAAYNELEINNESLLNTIGH